MKKLIFILLTAFFACSMAVNAQNSSNRDDNLIKSIKSTKKEVVTKRGIKKAANFEQKVQNKTVQDKTSNKMAFTDEDKAKLKAKFGVNHYKKYKGDYSPDAIAYLKTINFPFLIDTGNAVNDKKNYNAALEQWKQDNRENLEAVQLEVEQLNQKFNEKN